MNTPEIILTIDAMGDFDLEVLNAQGESCTELTKPLEEGLGIVDNRKFKPEYHQTNRLTNNTRLSN